MIGPSAAVVVGPPLVDAGAVLAADVAAAAVVAAALVPAAAPAVVAELPLLSPPHAAAITPNDTSSVVGTSHRCFVTLFPRCFVDPQWMAPGVRLGRYDTSRRERRLAARGRAIRPSSAPGPLSAPVDPPIRRLGGR